MKQLVTSILIGLLSIAITPTKAFSQNIDANRMNRDIRIMENILGELFRTQLTSSGSGSNSALTITSGYGNLSPRNIRGTYLTGYGVIFMVSNTNFFSAYRIATDNGGGSVSFYYDSDQNGDESRKVSVESVSERITEFLKDYGSTIGQLKDDENVMVIYGSKNNLDVQYVRLARAGQTSDDDKVDVLPVISVSSKASDLKAYRTGSINESTFENRIAVATSEDKEYLDLKVMSNIFETALREGGEESFRLAGSVNYLMLDNFGALFSMDVRYSDRGRSAITVWDLRETQVRRAAGVSTAEVSSEEADEKEAEFQKKIQDAYTQLITDIKEYIVDYGRTLSSLNNDQYLLLSVNVTGRYEGVPERLDVQVKKSVLTNLDRGSITRENAIKQVMVTEY